MTEVSIDVGGVELAGAIDIPRTGPPIAGVVMLPGSGAADRDNDGLFPPIRAHLLGRGIAVAAFDKRGVGGSGGDWASVGFEARTTDALAMVDALARAGVSREHVGLFGHSQGGWIALEAAAVRGTEGFVIVNGGPAVDVREQVRYDLATSLAGTELGPDEMDTALTVHDAALDLVASRRAWPGIRRDLARLRKEPVVRRLGDAGIDWPADEEWRFLSLIIDYDPLAAIRRLRCPLLALYGADDPLVPVDRSVAILRRELTGRTPSIEVFADADHRVRRGDPPTFADGYLEALADWIIRTTSARSGPGRGVDRGVRPGLTER